MWVGVLLMILGIAGLVIEYVTVTEQRTLAEFGPLELKTEEERDIPIPTIAGMSPSSPGLS